MQAAQSSADISPVKRQAGQRWLVLGPHQDDVALSVGGVLLQKRGEIDLTLVCLTTRSAWTVHRESRGNVGLVTSIRGAEERQFARSLGVECTFGGIDAAEIRGLARWRRGLLRWYRPRGRYPFRTLTQTDIGLFEAKVRELMQAHAPDVVLAPLGIGRHVDHLATFQAVIRAMCRQPADGQPQTRFLFYEDVPYVYWDYLSLVELVEQARGLGIEASPRVYDISDSLEDKLNALTIYRSQFDAQEYRTLVSKYSRYCGLEAGLSETPKERLWEFRGVNKRSLERLSVASAHRSAPIR